MVLQNVKNYMVSDMVSHCRRLESSATPVNPMKIANISRKKLCDMSRNIFKCEACLEDGSQHFKALV
jgi:hypothetical protein